jgi:antiviral helicase SLH1
MADTTFEWEAQWRAQMAQIRQTMESLPLPPLQKDSVYGFELDLDEEELSGDSLDNDVWEVDDEADDSPPSDHFPEDANGYHTPVKALNGVHDRTWLQEKCAKFSRSRSVEAHDLEQQITALLASDSSEDELQMSLTEMIGYDDLDFVIDLIKHRKDVLRKPTHVQEQTDGLFGQLQTRKEREAALRKQDYEHKHAELAPAMARSGPKYPHVYMPAQAATGNIDISGHRFALPAGHTHDDHLKYEDYAIPATKVGSLAMGQKLVAISEMDGLCKTTFRGYKSLNRMQSLLYPVAYGTSENMLICAPTGAGKTDAAMLTILHAISKNTLPNPIEEPEATDFVVMTEDFKIVYVTPMKALAAEVTEKLGKRLQWLGIQVRELTGDMQLTKKEIAATQIIVTTPEKWDVVTRKSTGDTELVQKVRLLVSPSISREYALLLDTSYCCSRCRLLRAFFIFLPL